jgi:hypothetical protein
VQLGTGELVVELDVAVMVVELVVAVMVVEITVTVIVTVAATLVEWQSVRAATAAHTERKRIWSLWNACRMYAKIT